MDFAEQLRIFQAAQGNPALLALATVDLAHEGLPAGERSRVKDALLAAAVPHWCDRDFLATLLQTTPEEGDRLLGQLRTLTVIEPFRARGEHAVNVHETARLALREHLRISDAALWETLSARARAHVVQSKEPHARIEALYHLFATDQPAAAEECEALDREVTQGGRPEVRYALALAFRELTAAGWLYGAAEVEALLSLLEVRNSRGEAAQLEPDAHRLVDLARSASHPSGVGRAKCLLGDVLKARGQLDDAMKAFDEYLGICQRLTSSAPSAVGWQRDLGIAYVKVGDIHEAQGRLDDALVAFRRTLAIFQRFAAAGSGWQRDIAVAYSRVGDIHQAQGHVEDALAAFREQLTILQRLASGDPSIADWQRELAVAHSKIGDMHQAQGRADDALVAFRETLTIFLRLVSIDPSNVGWQRDLAVAHSKVGNIHRAQGRADDALVNFREYLSISQRLTSADPANADWQRDLADAFNCLGQGLQGGGDETAAQSSFQSAVEVMERAVALAPGNMGWRQDLANLKSWLS